MIKNKKRKRKKKYFVIIVYCREMDDGLSASIIIPRRKPCERRALHNDYPTLHA
jgi:hypothetical protein